MAGNQPSGTFSVYDQRGINEDLEQIIFDISPVDVPFISMIARKKASNIRHEWQTDVLAAAVTTNAVVEGDEASIDSATATVRVSNICQIMDKAIIVSGTARAVDTAGRKDELAYQLQKRGRELKRDMEATVLANQASVLGNDTTARKLGGMQTWLTSNDSRASGGAEGGYSTTTSLTVAATDVTTGALRTFTETLLVDAMQLAFTNGGEPSVLLLSPFQKRQFVNSTNFPGRATLQSNVPQGKAASVMGNAEVYVGPFGTLKVVVDRFTRSRDAIVVDPEYASLAMLRPMSQWELSKGGDYERRQMLTEFTLVVENEAAHAIIADLKIV